MYSMLVGRLMRRVYRDICAGRFGLVERLAADDVVFVFPGGSSFGATLHGKAELLGWLRRFASLDPRIEVLDVVAGGTPWNLHVAVRFDDAIGEDYQNNVMELLRIRWGKVRRLDVFLDTERITAWEQRQLASQ